MKRFNLDKFLMWVLKDEWYNDPYNKSRKRAAQYFFLSTASETSLTFITAAVISLYYSITWQMLGNSFISKQLGFLTSATELKDHFLWIKWEHRKITICQEGKVKNLNEWFCCKWSSQFKKWSAPAGSFGSNSFEALWTSEDQKSNVEAQIEFEPPVL